MMVMMMIMMIEFDDDDDDEDEVDDDDDDDDDDDEDDDDDGDDDDDDDDDVDVERTRTGPYAVRPDLEHQVNYNATISHVYNVFSSYEECGPTGAGKTRCLAVTLLQYPLSHPHLQYSFQWL